MGHKGRLAGRLVDHVQAEDGVLLAEAPAEELKYAADLLAQVVEDIGHRRHR
jgi:hypothetical protein